MSTSHFELGIWISKNVVDCTDPHAIPIDGLLSRKENAARGVIKSKGEDRSIYMGRERERQFRSGLRDNTSQLYNQKYDEYAIGAGAHRKGGSLEDLASRASYRSQYLDLMTGPFAKTLRKQKAEIYRKTQSGVRRDAARIMAPIDGCDRVVIHFETGKFHPSKAAPYPLEKLKTVLKTQGPRERIPAFYQPVNHFKTSCISIACGARYTCPHEIRKCLQEVCIYNDYEFVRDNYSAAVTITTRGDMLLGGQVLSKFV